MAQGKLKAKVQPPKNGKNKKASKGAPVTKRANRPIQPKKKAFEESKKLKQIITKTVNKTAEEEIRSRATSSESKSLSKAQQAVAEYHTKKSTPAPT